MPRMPEGEGGEARGRLSCSQVISLWWPKDKWSCHIRVPSRGGRRLRGGIESTLPCSTDRQARRQHPQGGREAAYQAPVFWRVQQLQPRWPMAESATVRASSFWLRDRIAEGSCPRGATR
ncbi:hypothetical protein EMIHUDRAFT_460783, partial [Emiliania huxleyi CCMP1516]|uniref:Uncharacterized protein n=2 Tax=Emiliania huxleyi TaxID=2903 RepID=A0A0D3JBH9_EMIH1